MQARAEDLCPNMPDQLGIRAGPDRTVTSGFAASRHWYKAVPDRRLTPGEALGFALRAVD
jgi:hypothetical protein